LCKNGGRSCKNLVGIHGKMPKSGRKIKKNYKSSPFSSLNIVLYNIFYYLCEVILKVKRIC